MLPGLVCTIASLPVGDQCRLRAKQHMLSSPRRRDRGQGDQHRDGDGTPPGTIDPPTPTSLAGRDADRTHRWPTSASLPRAWPYQRQHGAGRCRRRDHLHVLGEQHRHRRPDQRGERRMLAWRARSPAAGGATNVACVLQQHVCHHRRRRGAGKVTNIATDRHRWHDRSADGPARRSRRRRPRRRCRLQRRQGRERGRQQRQHGAG